GGAVPAPESMVLATATPGGAPSARMGLLKEAGPDGFVFFTHYDNRKGPELAAKPPAPLVLHRQPPPAPGAGAGREEGAGAGAGGWGAWTGRRRVPAVRRAGSAPASAPGCPRRAR